MKFAAFFTALAMTLAAQETDRVTVPFSDPNRPRTVKVNLMRGNIQIKAHQGAEAIVEARHRSSSKEREEPRADGLRRIYSGGSGLSIEERDNVIQIGGSHQRSVDVTVHVPANTSVQLRGLHNNIEVEGINGEIEANSTNGAITLTNVSGSVVAHTLNGRVNVVFDRIAGDKPMSFSTLNGNIDVTLPADARARLKLKTHRGDVWSDFDVKLEPNTDPVKVEDERSKKARYRVKIERYMTATINGGGPEFQFTTMNGSIYIRKKK